MDCLEALHHKKREPSMQATLFLIASILLTANSIALAKQTDESISAKDRWNQRYAGEAYVYGKAPSSFLKNRIETLRKGRALVLAMGEGRNAVYLAENGYAVTGVDISEVAIEKCRHLAEERGVEVRTVVADLAEYDMGREEYDLITNFYFLDRSLFPKVIDALKPGGFFVFEQFSVDHLKYGKFGPRNRKYLVEPNELLGLFRSMRILYYEDTAVELDEGMHRGAAAVIRLIARKPSE
jgi:SAM-dependent methyltransferase